MKLKDWINKNQSVFIQRDLNLILHSFFSQKRYYFIEDYTPTSYQMQYLKILKEAYCKGWPLPYLIRKEEFFGFRFFVKRGIFIPRPETEIIVEKALEIINRNRMKRILDLCCGSCCIAITLRKKTHKNSIVYASDIDEEALRVSRENIRLHKVKIHLVRSDLFSAFKGKTFDVIVSNPPYVESGQIKGTLHFEPLKALDGGKNGLFFIYKILKKAPFYLKRGGCLILEMGYNHKDRVDKKLKDEGKFTVKEWIEDYSGFTRGVVLQLN